MKRSGLIPAIFLMAATAFPATAQTPTGTVMVTIKGVHSSQGNVLATLCDEPAGTFPGACMNHRAMAQASEGETTLSFDHVQTASMRCRRSTTRMGVSRQTFQRKARRSATIRAGQRRSLILRSLSRVTRRSPRR